MRVKSLVGRYGWWQVISLGRQMPRLTRLIARLMRDARVGPWSKAMLIAGVIYVVSPLDFLSDLVPVLGQLDDLALLALVVRAFLNSCPAAVVAEHDPAGRPVPVLGG
jgi:uncharacterized membrane protein YkvA (DUF1232 family)